MTELMRVNQLDVSQSCLQKGSTELVVVGLVGKCSRRQENQINFVLNSGTPTSFPRSTSWYIILYLEKNISFTYMKGNDSAKHHLHLH